MAFDSENENMSGLELIRLHTGRMGSNWCWLSILFKGIRSDVWWTRLHKRESNYVSQVSEKIAIETFISFLG